MMSDDVMQGGCDESEQGQESQVYVETMPTVQKMAEKDTVTLENDVECHQRETDSVK